MNAKFVQPEELRVQDAMTDIDDYDIVLVIQ